MTPRVPLQRMTKNRRRILKALAYVDHDNCAYPPYSAQQIADDTGLNLANVLRTLHDLHSAGLVDVHESRIWVHPRPDNPTRKLGCIDRCSAQRPGQTYCLAGQLPRLLEEQRSRCSGALAAFDQLFQ